MKKVSKIEKGLAIFLIAGVILAMISWSGYAIFNHPEGAWDFMGGMNLGALGVIFGIGFLGIINLWEYIVKKWLIIIAVLAVEVVVILLMNTFSAEIIAFIYPYSLSVVFIAMALVGGIGYFMDSFSNIFGKLFGDRLISLALFFAAAWSFFIFNEGADYFMLAVGILGIVLVVNSLCTKLTSKTDC